MAPMSTPMKSRNAATSMKPKLTPTKPHHTASRAVPASRAVLPASPVKVALEAQQLAFHRIRGRDCFWNQNAYKMSSEDLGACMRKCAKQGYGAFVVWNGTAFFRARSMQECRNNLFHFRASDVYLNMSQAKSAKAANKKSSMKVVKAMKAMPANSLPQSSLAFAKRALARSPGQPPSKRPRCTVPSWAQGVRLVRPQEPVGRPWPLRDLRAYDFPFDLGWGKLLEDVLKERGWRFSNAPCHATYAEDEDSAPCVFVKEFEAALRGQTPDEVFGKRGVAVEGYRLRKVPLPDHALWLMGRSFYRVPGTANGRAIWRDDFVQTVIDHGAELGNGTPGNYRFAKFPGTETACFKTNLTEAFREKPWYPTTYIIPKEREELLSELRSGDSHSYWIAKPRNDYGGTGIRVWKASDPDLVKLVAESESTPRSVVQRYLADPLLIGGYKFHMRIHLLITSLDPPVAHVQENGQCLFATKPYTLSGKTLGPGFDPPVHVTNMGLNATPANKENYFTKKPVVGRGQQIRMRQLESHLAENHPLYDRKALWSQILQIATDTTRYFAKAPAITRHGNLVPDRHFELFGMDLMLDKKLNVFMCEVNTDPGLSYPDETVLDSPNPDFNKEAKACSQTVHDMFSLLGLDAGRPQPNGSLQSWFKLDFGSPA